jgi:hypothetical protein
MSFTLLRYADSSDASLSLNERSIATTRAQNSSQPSPAPALFAATLPRFPPAKRGLSNPS